MSDVYKAPEAELRDPSQAGEYGSMETALAGNYELRPVEIVKEAWATMMGMKMQLWIAMIIYGVLSGIYSAIQAGVAGDPMTGNFSAPSYMAMTILQMVIFAPMGAGLFMIALKHSVGGKAQFAEIFQHYNKVVPLFLCTLIMYILIAIGFVLLIIPGIYLMVAFSMALALVVEKNMSPWEALMASRKALTHKWFPVFGLNILIMLVVLAGVIALLVGLVWAVPCAMLAFAIAYRNIFGVEESTKLD